eukprot:366136-Chlamydomonas_euryale.AAC.10
MAVYNGVNPVYSCMHTGVIPRACIHAGVCMHVSQLLSCVVSSMYVHVARGACGQACQHRSAWPALMGSTHARHMAASTVMPKAAHIPHGCNHRRAQSRSFFHVAASTVMPEAAHPSTWLQAPPCPRPLILPRGWKHHHAHSRSSHQVAASPVMPKVAHPIRRLQLSTPTPSRQQQHS